MGQRQVVEVDNAEVPAPRGAGYWKEPLMKNAWKGLVLGGLTGVAAGAVLDALDRGAREATILGERAVHQAPQVVGRLRHAVTDAVADGSRKFGA